MYRTFFTKTFTWFKNITQIIWINKAFYHSWWQPKPEILKPKVRCQALYYKLIIINIFIIDKVLQWTTKWKLIVVFPTIQTTEWFKTYYQCILSTFQKKTLFVCL